MLTIETKVESVCVAEKLTFLWFFFWGGGVNDVVGLKIVTKIGLLFR